jgi:hypothetical protein
MRPTIEAFFRDRRVQLSQEAVDSLSDEASRVALVPDVEALLTRELSTAWKRHWKLPPSRRFFAEIVDRIVAENPEVYAARLLESHLRRWDTRTNSLPLAA